MAEKVDSKEEAREYAKAIWDVLIATDLSARIKEQPSTSHEIIYIGLDHLNAEQFDLLIKESAAYIRKSAHKNNLIPARIEMPVWIAEFTADVLEGNRKRPAEKRGRKNINLERNFKLLICIDEVTKKFRLQKYVGHELSKQVTAAQIVSEVSGESVGVIINVIKNDEKNKKRQKQPRSFNKK